MGNAQMVRKAYESYLRSEKCMRERSVRDYLSVYDLLSKHIDIIGTTTYKPVNDAIRTIKEAEGWSQGTVYKYSICVRQLYRWLHREQYIPQNPYPFSEWKKPRFKAPKFLTESQFKALIDDPNLTHMEYTLLYILWDSGARISEIAALEQRHIDLAKMTVNIPYEISKGNYSFRYVPITQECAQALQRQINYVRRAGHDKAIFIKSDNAPMRAGGLGKMVNAIGLRQSPLREQMVLGPHQFRHSFGIRMIEKGVPQIIVQKWLGHQTLEMTSRYVNMDQESSRKIFETYVPA